MPTISQMPEPEKIDQDVSPHVDEPASTGQRKARKAYSKVRRELSEEELQNPSVQRVLVNELDRLEDEVTESRHFR